MVDKFINYSENVDNIQEAFAFIMEYMEEFESPDIRIQPFTSYENLLDMNDDDKGEQKFGVSVSGTVE